MLLAELQEMGVAGPRLEADGSGLLAVFHAAREGAIARSVGQYDAAITRVSVLLDSTLPSAPLTPSGR
jgi:hypothetical protein